eukprot:gene31022-20966_t
MSGSCDVGKPRSCDDDGDSTVFCTCKHTPYSKITTGDSTSCSTALKHLQANHQKANNLYCGDDGHLKSSKCAGDKGVLETFLGATGVTCDADGG